MKAPGPDLGEEEIDEVEIGMPLLLTLSQAARLCQVSLPTLQNWSHMRGFPVIRRHRLVRIHAKLLDR